MVKVMCCYFLECPESWIHWIKLCHKCTCCSAGIKAPWKSPAGFHRQCSLQEYWYIYSSVEAVELWNLHKIFVDLLTSFALTMKWSRPQIQPLVNCSTTMQGCLLSTAQLEPVHKQQRMLCFRTPNVMFFVAICVILLPKQSIYFLYRK